MTTAARPTSRTTPAVPPPAAASLRVLATLLLLGVLLQSVSAGGHLGGLGAWGLTAHEIGANATFAVAVVEGLLVLAVPSLRADRRLLGGLLAIGLALTAIIGLGYVGGGGLVVHVPLAVLVAIGATHHLASVRRVTA